MSGTPISRRKRREKCLVPLDSRQDYGFENGIETEGDRKKEREREKENNGAKKNARRTIEIWWALNDSLVMTRRKSRSRAGGGRTGIKFRSGSTTRALARFIAGFTPRSFMQRRTTNLCHITEYKDEEPELGQRARERGMDV